MNIVNNVDVDLLPDFFQDVVLREFANLPIKHKLIVYAKLVHGHMFKVTSNDLFNINKQTPGIVYRKFVKDISAELGGIAHENHKRKKKSKRNTRKGSRKRSSRKK